MTLHAISQGTMLFLSGIWTGANLIILFERVRSWQNMSNQSYQEDFRRTVLLSKSFMMATGLFAVLSGSVLVLTNLEANRMLTSLGVSIMGLMVSVSGFMDWFGHAYLGAPQPVEGHFAHHRAFWRRFYLLRMLGALVAFSCLCAAGQLHSTEWIMIIFGGLWSGGVCFLLVERSRAWHRMAPDQFLTDFRASVRFIDPVMPICFITSVIAGGFISYHSTGITAVIGWLGVGVATVGAVLSGVLSAPSVLALLRSEVKVTPAQLKRARSIILACNVGRTVGAVSAFICFNAVVVIHCGF